MGYWLFKTEPDVFGLEDLIAAPQQTARWDEIRNYQARNFLRDKVKLGDKVFIYHSQCKPTAIVGLAKVVKTAYPDPSQFDPESAYHDPKSDPTEPRWYSVDIKFSHRFDRRITLAEVKSTKGLEDMLLVKQGRLSVQPVSEAEATILFGIANAG